MRCALAEGKLGSSVWTFEIMAELMLRSDHF